MRKTTGLWPFWVAALLAAPGCGGRGTTASEPKPPGPLHVAAASDLQTVLPKVVERYERESPGRKVVLTFGATGQLAEQVKAGAPFDLFLAANEAFVNDLATEHYVDRGSIRPYAVGSLVIAVNRERGGDLGVKGLADLLKPGVKAVALANTETAPYGMAAKQALERAGLWEQVRPKVVYAETVRQALRFVESGNAEAGLVSRATADTPGVDSVEVDPGLYAPIVQCLGVVTRSVQPTEAERFARFLTGPGRADLDAHGFKRPPVSVPR